MRLIAAEAELALGNAPRAIALIDEIRAAAELPPYGGPATPADVMKQILFERSVELFLEAKHLADLRRSNDPLLTDREKRGPMLGRTGVQPQPEVRVAMRRTPLVLALTILWSSPAAGQQAAVVQTGDLSSAASPRPQAGAPQKRALRLEDYYRMRSVGSPRISPDGQWVAYTVSLPVEETNGNITEAWLVRSDASAQAVRVAQVDGNLSNLQWTDDHKLRFAVRDTAYTVDPTSPDAPATREAGRAEMGELSPDGRWYARTREVPREPRAAPAVSDFERRHDERFKGDAFDWYPFRQDGQRFPLPNRAERTPNEIFLVSADDTSDALQLTHLGLQPGGLRWTPDGTGILFTVNDDATERTYGSTDIFRVGIDGTVTQLTDDGYNYGNVDFSPDGRWMSYTSSFGTDMIMEQKLNHGGSQDLFVRPSG